MKSPEVNNVLQALIKCITACENCATACLEEDDVKMMENCIKTDRDCADICTLTTRYIARDSRYCQDILKMCIEICYDCEKECSKHDHDHCQICAEKCRECRKECKEFLATIEAHHEM
jgi:hypothetical protein